MEGMKIIMQSCEPPVCDGAWDIEIRKVPEEFLSACRYSFFLRFSPVSKHDGKVTNVHTREADAIQWLCRRGEKYGVEFEARSMEKMNSGKIIMSLKLVDVLVVIGASKPTVKSVLIDPSL